MRLKEQLSYFALILLVYVSVCLNILLIPCATHINIYNEIIIETDDFFFERDLDFKSGLEINQSHRNLIYESHFESWDSLYTLYNTFIKNEFITSTIVDYSHFFEVPVHKMIAMAFVESCFNPKAINRSNGNGSKDYGLFQLNSKTFYEYDQAYLMDVETNVHFAVQHLLGEYEKYESWEKAVIAYNAGNVSKVFQSSIDYFLKVQKYEKMLDKIYHEWRLR